MPKYSASIFLIAAVLCCSSLAYPFYDFDEFLPTDEGKLRRDIEKERNEHEMRQAALWNDEATLRRNEKHQNKAPSSRKHKREPDTNDNEELKRKAAEEIVNRLAIVQLTVDTVKESEKASLREILEDAAKNRQWNSINDFIEYCAKIKVKADLRAQGIVVNESDLDLSLDSSEEA